MRVIVYGHKRAAKKLKAFLAKEGIEVEYSAAAPSTNLASQVPCEFDLAIVDSQGGNTEATCRHFREFCDIPLVLIVNKKQANWKELQSLDVDGYLPEDAENGELAARLKALLRRFCPAGQLGEMEPVLKPL